MNRCLTVEKGKHRILLAFDFVRHRPLLFLDIDPCDGLLQSENVIFSGFSRTVVALFAAAN